MNKRLFLPIPCLLSLFFWSACDLEKIEPGGGGGPIETFETHFSLGANKTIYVKSVLEAVDGGFIISGYTSRNDVNIQQLFIVKTSATGSTEKVKTDFNLLGNLDGGKLIRTTDNKYAMIGTNSDLNVVLLKLDTDLSVIWSKVYGDVATEERGDDLVETADGHYLLACSKGTGNADNPYFIKARTDNGAETDNELVDVVGNGNYHPVSIARNGSSYGVFGYNLAVSIPALFFVKIDQNLSPLINKSLSELGNYNGEIVANSTDGFVIASGVVSQLLVDAYMLDLSGNGDESRTDLFTSADKGNCEGISRTSSGLYLPAGWVQVSNGGGTVSAAVAALLSSTYSTKFTYQYGSNNTYTSFQTSAQVSDGGFVFAGRYGDNADEVLLVKLTNELKLN